jgi:hypothetical protein
VYQGSITHCDGYSAIGFAAIQSLGSTEDSTAGLDDLPEVLSHGVTLVAQLSEA